MSVDIKSLRIGSHVSIGSKRRCITAIDEFNAMIGIDAYKTDANGVKHPLGYAVDSVEPIPIDENELRRCGFVGDGEDVFIDHNSACIMRENLTRMPDVRICKCQDGYWGVAMLCSSFHCRYLHELESLYYHVFKKELIE